MLSDEERKRRIEAARVLRGISQKKLNELVAGDGLDKLAAGRAERGEIPLSRALRDSLCRHLRVPSWWFTDAEIVLEERQPDSIEQRLDRIEAATMRFAAAVRLEAERQAAHPGSAPATRPGEDVGGGGS